MRKRFTAHDRSRTYLVLMVLLVLVAPATAQAQDVPDVVWEARGDSVSQVAFAPDGQLVAIGSSAGTVALRRVRDGQLVRTIAPSGGGEIRALAFSPDSQLLAVGTSMTYLHLTIWRVATGALRNGPFTGGGRSAAFSADGRFLATGTASQAILIWRVSDMQVLQSLRFTGYGNIVYRVAFSPDGALLASSGSNLYVRLWQPSNGTMVRKLAAGGIGVPKRGLVFLPDGRTLATASDDRSIRLWRVSDGAALRTLTASDPVRSLAVTSTGDTLISAGNGIAFWSVADGDLLLTYDDQGVTALALSRDDRFVCYGRADGTVALVDDPF